MTPELTTYEDNRSSSEIESDIRETRGRMDSTLDELSNRLTARSLMNSALDWWDSPAQGNQGSAALRKAAGTLARQARQHPMPAVLIGAGVAWLILESVDHDDEPGSGYSQSRGTEGPSGWDRTDTVGSVGEWVDDKVDDVKGAATSVIDSARGKSQQIGSKIQETKDRMEEQAHCALDRSKEAARQVRDELKSGYQSAHDKFEHACDEYPLAVGAAFAALGALAGLVIPRSRREDELMGERSDKIVEETKEKAVELLEVGKQVGSKVLETVLEEAREQGFTAGAVSETLSNLTERGGQVLEKAKDAAVQSTDDQGITPTSEALDEVTANDVTSEGEVTSEDITSQNITSETNSNPKIQNHDH